MPNAKYLPGGLYWPKPGMTVEAGYSLWKGFRSRLGGGRWKTTNRIADLPGYLLDDAGIDRRNTDWITSEKVKRLRCGMNW